MAGLHDGARLIIAGAEPGRASAALVLIHGRGATAESMLPLAEALGREDIRYLAPQAAGNTWYPYSFLAPIEQNEPWLSSALAAVGATLQHAAAEGFDYARIGLLGFSQGACLATEYSARNPRRYGCVIGLSGGLIGPSGTARSYPGSLEGTPVFLGCSDIDPHIPLNRVRETTRVLQDMGAAVDERIYRGMGHTVNADELAAVQLLLATMAPEVAT